MVRNVLKHEMFGTNEKTEMKHPCLVSSALTPFDHTVTKVFRVPTERKVAYGTCRYFSRPIIRLSSLLYVILTNNRLMFLEACEIVLMHLFSIRWHQKFDFTGSEHMTSRTLVVNLDAYRVKAVLTCKSFI